MNKREPADYTTQLYKELIQICLELGWVVGVVDTEDESLEEGTCRGLVIGEQDFLEDVIGQLQQGGEIYNGHSN